MKSKTMILMVLAIGCGLVASILTSRMLAQQGQGETEKVTVLVAKQKIALGQSLKEPEKFFVEKQFLKGTEPKGAITKFEDLKGRRLSKPLGVDVHVTPEDLDESSSGLSAVLRPGYRAIAIKVSADTNVAGFVQPNSRVDIISTVRNGEQNSVARIILENMLVLAVDHLRVKAEDKEAHVASTVTLEAKPDEAEKLTMAVSMGELRLVLRNHEDEASASTKGARPSDVLRGKAGGDATESGDGKTETTSPITGLKVPDAPATLVPGEGPRAEVKVTPPKTHKLTVYNGENVIVAVFIQKEDGNDSTEINKSQPETPAKKPETPAAPPAAPPTTEPKKPSESDVATPPTNPKTGTRTQGQKTTH